MANLQVHVFKLFSLQAGLQVLEEDSTQLWWAGKELVRGKKLMDFIGKNEKTKIVAKLQKKGQGAPAREPVFTEDEKKKMMSYAYKKQEEMKVLHNVYSYVCLSFLAVYFLLVRTHDTCLFGSCRYGTHACMSMWC